MIESFHGKYAFLSNFYPCIVNFEEQTFCSVEAAYQAAKTTDKESRAKFQCVRAGEAKSMGRQLQLREGWEGMKEDIMLTLLREKFSSSSLRRQLLETGAEELVEGNYWGDTFWGVYRGKGENKLGRLLMQVRGEG